MRLKNSIWEADCYLNSTLSIDAARDQTAQQGNIFHVKAIFLHVRWKKWHTKRGLVKDEVQE